MGDDQLDRLWDLFSGSGWNDGYVRQGALEYPDLIPVVIAAGAAGEKDLALEIIINRRLAETSKALKKKKHRVTP